MGHNTHRHYDKGQNQEDQACQSQQQASLVQSRKLAERRRVTEAQEEDNHGEEQVCRHGPGEEADSNQGHKGDPGDDAVTPGSQDGVHNVATVQLSDGEQVEAGGQHSKPSRPADGMQVDAGFGSPREKEQGSQAKQQGFSKLQALLSRDSKNEDLGVLESDDESWEDEDESGQGSCDPHIEKLAPVGKYGSDSNDGAKGAKHEGWWPRYDVGQSGLDAVVAAGQVMPHLVGQQDQQDSKREGETVKKVQRVGEGSGESNHGFIRSGADKTNMKLEAGHQGGEEGGCQQNSRKKDTGLLGRGRRFEINPEI